MSAFVKRAVHPWSVLALALFVGGPFALPLATAHADSVDPSFLADKKAALESRADSMASDQQTPPEADGSEPKDSISLGKLGGSGQSNLAGSSGPSTVPACSLLDPRLMDDKLSLKNWTVMPSDDPDRCTYRDARDITRVTYSIQLSTSTEPTKPSVRYRWVARTPDRQSGVLSTSRASSTDPLMRTDYTVIVSTRDRSAIKGLRARATAVLEVLAPIGVTR